MWKFNPILKETIWGGSRIPEFKRIGSVSGRIGESWEISDLPGAESVVSEGKDVGLTIHDLIKKYGNKMMGERITSRYGEHFPLLVKFIDANADLSVQVHPNDIIAENDGYRNGKNEMWYVIDATENATLANGFKESLSPESYRMLVESGDIIDKLNFIKVAKGDAFYIPSGRVHTIGKGIFLVEIQQSSDVTYRIYDYGRTDAEGKPRQLHTEKACKAINFSDTEGGKINYIAREGFPNNLVQTSHFTTNIWHIHEMVLRDYREFDTFAIIVAIDGKASFSCGDETLEIEAGTSVLIPASAQGIRITPHGSFSAIETYIK